MKTLRPTPTIACLAALACFVAHAYAGHFLSNTPAGFWHDPAAWLLVSGTDDGGDGIPSGTDTVEIQAGQLIEMHQPHTAADVTVFGTLRGSTYAAIFDLTHDVGNVTIKNGGVLEVADGRETETITFNVHGNLTIEDGGLIKAAAFGNQSTIILTVAGNWTDQKTSWFSVYGGAANDWTLKFVGTAPATMTMVSGASSDFADVVVDTGKTLTINSPRPFVVTGGHTFTVKSGATLRLDLGAFFYAPSGTATFTMDAGATLAMAAAHGLDKTQYFQGSFTLNIPNAAANFIYYGTGGQNTGPDLPAAVNDLTIQTPDWVTLTNDVAVNGVLNLAQGRIDGNGRTIYASAIESNITGPGWISGGTLARTFDAATTGPRTFPVGTPTKKLPLRVDITSPGSGFGFLSVSLQNASHPSPPAFPTVPYYWTVQGPAFSGFAATMTLSYDDADLGTMVENALRVVRYDGSTWHVHTGPVDQLANTVEATGVTGFSDWTVGQPYNSSVADWALY